MNSQLHKVLALCLLMMSAPLMAVAEEPVASHDEQSREYFTDLTLYNQDGEPVRFYTDVLKDQLVVLNFIFTNCGSACPMMTEKMRVARGLMSPELAARVRYVSISIDPKRDSPKAMKEFAERHHADGNWVFLTGAQENIDKIVKKLGQYNAEVEAHSTMMLAGNVAKRHWIKLPPNVPPPGIAEKLADLDGG